MVDDSEIQNALYSNVIFFTLKMKCIIASYNFIKNPCRFKEEGEPPNTLDAYQIPLVLINSKYYRQLSLTEKLLN